MRRRPCSQPGFVLLLTLVVLALAAVVMVDVSRRGVEHAAAAAEAGHDLQRRWGVASARAAVLPRVDAILDDERRRRGEPVAELAVALDLGEQRFGLVVADEQAKVNLNAVYREHGLDAATRAVAAAVGSAPGSPIADLKPDPRSGRGGGPAIAGTIAEEIPGMLPGAAAVVPFGSWSQVFRDPAPDALLRTDEDRRRPVASVTCWGDGRLNLMRASRDAIASRAGRLLSSGDIDRLIEGRDQLFRAESGPDDRSDEQTDPGSTASPATPPEASLLAVLDLTDRQREALGDIFTEESHCRSLTMLIEHEGRRYRELAILTRPTAASEPGLPDDQTDVGTPAGEPSATEPTQPETRGSLGPPSPNPAVWRFVW